MVQGKRQHSLRHLVTSFLFYFPKKIIKILSLTVPQHLPQVFNIFCLPNNIYCLILSVLNQLPGNTQWWKTKSTRDLARGNIVTLSSCESGSAIPYSLILPPDSNETSPFPIFYNKSDKYIYLKEDLQNWSREQSMLPSHICF